MQNISPGQVSVYVPPPLAQSNSKNQSNKRKMYTIQDAQKRTLIKTRKNYTNQQLLQF